MGKQACVPQLLSSSFRALELQLKPAHLEPMPHNKRRRCSEKPAHHSYNSPHSSQLEKACMQRRAQPKINYFKKKKPVKWKRIFVNQTFVKELVVGLYKKFLQFNKISTNNLILKCADNLNRHFSIENI